MELFELDVGVVSGELPVDRDSENGYLLQRAKERGE
jgi:hypothetical protein